MDIKTEAQRIMKLNVKSKAEGDAVIAKFAKRNGAAKAAELRDELKRLYRSRK